MSDNMDFIQAWNDTIPFKIKPNDLCKPTETFLIKALVSYLLKLNVDVSRVNAEIPSDVRRTEKIKLCHYINHLYTLSDNSNNFFYIDLLHPPPKKTAHLLKILLNYYHYYNLVKTEVIVAASTAISTYDNLLSKRNQQERENEENKIINHNEIINVQSKMALLPELQETHRHYEMKKEAIDNELVDLETKLKNSEYSIDQLKTKIDKVKSEVVMESEIKYLLDQLATLDEQIEEYNAMEVTGRENNQIIVQLLPLLEEFNKKLEEIIEILNTMIIQPADLKQLCNQLILQIKEENKLSSEIDLKKVEKEKAFEIMEIEYQRNIELKGIELKKILDIIQNKICQVQQISSDEKKYETESFELDLNVNDLQSQLERMTKMIENAFKILLNKK